MHRSGTSFLSRALNLGGVYLGTYSELTSTDWNPFSDNLGGHWEHQEILKLSEETLSISGGNWHEPPKTTKINDILEQKIQKTIQSLHENGFLLSGFKDPRTIVCFDSWKKCFPRNIIFIGIFRHPLKVAESLKKRDDFSYEKSIELWKQYNSKLLQIISKHQGFLLDFDSEPTKLITEIKNILNSLGLNKKTELEKWFNPDLKHADKTLNEQILDPETQSLYSELIKYSKQKINITNFEYSNTDYLKTIENYSTEYQKMGTFFKKLLREKDQQLTNLQSSLTEKDQQLTNLQSSLTEKDQQLTNLQSSLTEKDQQLTNLQSSLTEKDQQLTNLQSSLTEKDQQLTNLQSSLTEKDQQLTNLQSSLTEKDQQLTNLQSSLTEKDQQLTNLQSSLTEKDQQLTNLQSSLEQTQKILNDIQNSFTWRILKKFDRIKNR